MDRNLDQVEHMASGTRRTALALAMGAVAMLGACKKGGEASDTTATAMTPPADTGMHANSTATGAATTPSSATTTLTDAQILGMVIAANRGEVDAGKTAESKATNASVKAFARDMVTDHGKMLSDAQALAKKINITPDSAAADSIRNANAQTASALSSAAKGKAFDSTYVAAQVTGHQNTLDMVKRAEGAAQNAELKTALNHADSVVSKHLDRIKDIQGKMQ
jgi:putative membrane protein